MEIKMKEDVNSPEMKSQYLEGLVYTVRSSDDPAVPEAVRKTRARFAVLAAQWLKDGKAEISDGARAKLSGKQ
jgi:hypothetical protein